MLSPGMLCAEDIGRGLEVRRIGRRITVLSETESTNDVALADDGGEDGLAVFAEYQTRGRGRLGRRWSSPRGASVLCSVRLLDCPRTAQSSFGPAVLTLAAGVAVCDAAASAAPDLSPTLRWPNDVVVNGKKLAGVLIESCWRPGGRACAIGIGVNCLQQRGHFERDLGGLATSLEAESRHPICRLTVARRLLVELDRWLADPPDLTALRQAWLDRAEPLGQHIHVRQGGDDFLGTTVDLDPTAGLIVQLDGGGRRAFDPATTTLLGSTHIGRTGP